MCDTERSDADAVALVERIFRTLECPLVYMDPEEHDLHAAYVSHISHVTSFALALTVLEKEREERHIFDLAGGGFESTVRLAKSADCCELFRGSRSSKSKLWSEPALAS